MKGLDVKSTIKKKLSKAHIKEALDIGLNYLDQKYFILLSSKYERLCNRKRNEIITDHEYDVGCNQITISILEYLENIEDDNSFNKRSKSKFTIFLIFILSFLDYKKIKLSAFLLISILAAFIGIIFFEQEEFQINENSNPVSSNTKDEILETKDNQYTKNIAKKETNSETIRQLIPQKTLGEKDSIYKNNATGNNQLRSERKEIATEPLAEGRLLNRDSIRNDLLKEEIDTTIEFEIIVENNNKKPIREKSRDLDEINNIQNVESEFMPNVFYSYPLYEEISLDENWLIQGAAKSNLKEMEEIAELYYKNSDLQIYVFKRKSGKYPYRVLVETCNNSKQASKKINYIRKKYGNIGDLHEVFKISQTKLKKY